MTYEVYHTIFIVSAVLCGIMFAVSVFLFVFFHVPGVISDLSGASERKAIQNIYLQNEQSKAVEIITAKIATEELPESGETTLLSGGNEKTVLQDGNSCYI